MHLQPERIRVIQKALIQAKCLNGEPTGKWDDATREAMQKFQQKNGFSPTGLPEAKALMKLGLGPHPLPPGLRPKPPSQEGQTNGSGSGESVSASASTSAPKQE